MIENEIDREVGDAENSGIGFTVERKLMNGMNAVCSRDNGGARSRRRSPLGLTFAVTVARSVLAEATSPLITPFVSCNW